MSLTLAVLDGGVAKEPSGTTLTLISRAVIDALQASPGLHVT